MMEAPLWWLLFGLTHSLLAQNGQRLGLTLGKKTAYHRLWRLSYNLLALALSLKALHTGWHEAGSPPTLLLMPSLMAILFALAGIYLIQQGFQGYRLSSFLGLRNPQPIEPLATRGIHTVVRHPLYSGTLLILLAWGIIWPAPTHLVSLLVLLAYTLIGLEFEEKDLRKIYGETYLKYEKQTPWKIIPKIW